MPTKALATPKQRPDNIGKKSGNCSVRERNRFAHTPVEGKFLVNDNSGQCTIFPK
jgi:hypothetical protein